MHPFIAWISDRKVEFSKQHPDAFAGGAIHNHDMWTKWLEAYADELARSQTENAHGR